MTTTNRAARTTLVVFMIALGVLLTPASSPASPDLPAIRTESKIYLSLDQDTRNWLDKQKAEVRKEFIAALEQGLSLIDKSVDRYLKQIDLIIYTRLNQVSCLGASIPKGFFEEAKAAVFGGRPKPLYAIVREFDTFGSRIGQNADPKWVTIAYEQFLIDAGVTYCQLSMAPEAMARIDMLLEKARERQRVWNSLNGCANARVCLESRLAAVRGLIESSDPRDVGAAEAAKVVAAVVIPDRPGFFSSFDVVPYERQLTSLYQAQRRLEIAKARRELKGNDHLVSASESFASATTLRLQARAALSDTSPESNGAAITISTRADSPAAEIRGSLDAAVNEHPLLKEPAAKLRAELTALLADTASIRQAAIARNRKIRGEPQGRRHRGPASNRAFGRRWQGRSLNTDSVRRSHERKIQSVYDLANVASVARFALTSRQSD